MSYIFGKLWHSAIIWPIRKSFQCILQGVRFSLAKQTQLSGTSDNESYVGKQNLAFSGFQFLIYIPPSPKSRRKRPRHLNCVHTWVHAPVRKCARGASAPAGGGTMPVIGLVQPPIWDFHSRLTLTAEDEGHNLMIDFVQCIVSRFELLPWLPPRWTCSFHGAKADKRNQYW